MERRASRCVLYIAYCHNGMACMAVFLSPSMWFHSATNHTRPFTRRRFLPTLLKKRHESSPFCAPNILASLGYARAVCLSSSSAASRTSLVASFLNASRERRAPPPFKLLRARATASLRVRA